MKSDREQIDEFWRENRDLYNKDENEFYRRKAQFLKNLSDEGSVIATAELIFRSDRHCLNDDEFRFYMDRISKSYNENPEAFDSGLLYQVGEGVACRGKPDRQKKDERTLREALKWLARSMSKDGISCLSSIVSIYKNLPNCDDELFGWCIWGLEQSVILRADGYSGVWAIVLSADTIVKMAVNGHSPSQYRLGMMYLKGDILKRSDEMAKEWFSRSAEGGYEKAITAMEGYRMDGNFLSLVKRDYLQPDDYGIKDMPKTYLESWE